MWKSVFRFPRSEGKPEGGFPVGFSIDRHFLGPLLQASILRGQPQSLKEFGFGLLHAPRRVGIADGGGDPLQRLHTQSMAQVLCRIVQQRQGFQRSLIALVTYTLASFLVHEFTGFVKML